MPIPCVPPPRYFFDPGREADWLLYLQLQDVKGVCLYILGLGYMDFFLELAPTILAQVVFFPAVQALDRPAISRLLLLVPFFPARVLARFPWLFTAFAARGPVALAGVVVEL